MIRIEDPVAKYSKKHIGNNQKFDDDTNRIIKNNFMEIIV
jgi:hypothetical protein